jgi:type IV secretory pathway VirB10-like protein
VIGAIFFGSHLIVFALRYLFPGTQDDQEQQPATAAEESAVEKPAVRVVETVLDPEPEDIAKRLYAILLDLDQPIGRDKLAKVCGIPARAAVRVRKAVEQEREEAELRREEEARQAAERKSREEELAEAQRYTATVAASFERNQQPVPEATETEPTNQELTAGMTPAEVLSGPGITILRQQWRDKHAAEQSSPNGSGPAS